MRNTSERLIPGRQESVRQRLLYLRHLFAYEHVRQRIPENSHLLEVGCGEGYGADLLARHVNKIVALDVDVETLRHASRQYASENCSFHEYDGVRIPYDDGTFDVVVSFQVIEHIRDDCGYVREIHRVLKPNGVFFLTTPNLVVRVPPGQKPWNRYHVREYDSRHLETVLRQAFSDVGILGIRGTDEAQRIELERIRAILRVVSYDPLNLRNLVPEFLRQLFIRLMEQRDGRRTRGGKQQLRPERFTVADYSATHERIDESLDLMAISRKQPA